MKEHTQYKWGDYNSLNFSIVCYCQTKRFSLRSIISISTFILAHIGIHMRASMTRHRDDKLKRKKTADPKNDITHKVTQTERKKREKTQENMDHFCASCRWNNKKTDLESPRSDRIGKNTEKGRYRDGERQKERRKEQRERTEQWAELKKKSDAFFSLLCQLFGW